MKQLLSLRRQMMYVLLTVTYHGNDLTRPVRSSLLEVLVKELSEAETCNSDDVREMSCSPHGIRS
jgi:hypothetical protein